MAKAIVDDELKLNKERLKILYGGKPTKKVPIPKIPLKKVSKPKGLKEEKIFKTINLSANYFKMDINVSDLLNSIQTLAEQAVYNRLYRLSVGYHKNICRIGMGALAKSINIKSSQKTVKRAIGGLIKKGHIKKFDTNKQGTLYQICLPLEIEGVKNTVVNSTIVKNTVVNSTPSTVVKNTTPCSKKYYSQQKITSLTPLNTDGSKKHFFPKYNLKIYINNNRDVVVNFFNQRFKDHQKTLSIKTTERLLENHNLDKIIAYINRIPNDGSIRNPAGLLYKALDNNWELAPTKEEVLEKEVLRSKKEIEAQQEKNRIERAKFERAKAEEKRLNRIFTNLSKRQQEQLRSKAIEILKCEYSSVSPQVFDSVVATETMIMIKMREILKQRGEK